MKISTRQFNDIASAKKLDFFSEMAAFFAKTEPELFATLSLDEQLLFVQACRARCEVAGLSSTAATYTWADFAILLGSYFDRDPYFAFVMEELQKATVFTQDDHLVIAQEAVGAYLTEVRGKDGAAFKASFAYLQKLVLPETDRAAYDAAHRNDIEAEQMRLAQMIYPEMVAYHGYAATTDRVQHFLQQGYRNYGIRTPWGLGFYTQMGMAFGIGMDRDELYPWIGRTLARTSTLGPEKMMDQLGSKAHTWFSQILGDTAKEDA